MRRDSRRRDAGQKELAKQKAEGSGWRGCEQQLKA
jgi:hypothetical protein